MIDFTSWNATVIEEFRANGGRVEQFPDMPLLILHNTGAKSGETRLNPLAYMRRDDSYVLFASRAGEPINPDWFHNLRANPEVVLEFGDRSVAGVAQEVTGAERDELYAEQVRLQPTFGEYEKKTTRTIPVVVVTPHD